MHSISDMKHYHDQTLDFVNLYRIGKYWITVEKEVNEEKIQPIKIFYNHFCLSVGEIQKKFDKAWLSCKVALEEHFSADGLTFKIFNDILDSLNDLFTNKYNTIYEFIVTYPEEDDYAHKVYNEMCDVLRDILKLLTSYEKELAKIVVNGNGNEDYNLDYIKESIEQIKNYHIEC